MLLELDERADLSPEEEALAEMPTLLIETTKRNIILSPASRPTKH